MTLVVARRFADAPRLVCDTQLTDPLGRRLNPFGRGALKLVIVHRGLCIGFDGGEITGLEAVLDAGRSAAFDYDLAEVRRGLTRASRSSTNGFLVASLSPVASLVRIRDGVDEGEVGGAWLGSRPAFSAYQGYFATAGSLPHEIQHDYQSHLSTEERSTASRMLPAMMRVIEDGRFGEVGGLPICVASTARGFRYESTAMLAADHDQVIEPEEGWVDADWGTAAEGGFGYAIKTPDRAGVGAVGAYFPHGRFGILYYPGHALERVPFQDVIDAQFCRAVEERFGFPFGRKGLGFGESAAADSLTVTV
jgi:hypothetical protein